MVFRDAGLGAFGAGCFLLPPLIVVIGLHVRLFDFRFEGADALVNVPRIRLGIVVNGFAPIYMSPSVLLTIEWLTKFTATITPEIADIWGGDAVSEAPGCDPHLGVLPRFRLGPGRADLVRSSSGPSV